MIELIEAGMNVARFNFSHGTHAEHLKTINDLKKAREIANRPVAIMLDTKGPEIRIGKISKPLQTQMGMHIELVKNAQEPNQIPIHPLEALECIQPGMTVLFSDGYIISHVTQVRKGVIEIEMQDGGILKSGMKVNVPDVNLKLPAITPEDVADLKFGCENDVDLIAASFIRSAHHVLAIKTLLANEGRSDILVIAKIENREGVKNIDSIVQVADGIMVARGDLGVELDLALVPKLQKMMIRKCFQACKPVITATQMLESMIVNARPTRAEVSDVANAIYDCSSAVMLSGETAVGKFPIEAVRRMKSIIEAAEEDFDYRRFFEERSHRDYHDTSSALSIASVQTAYSANARAIFVFTTSGRTARLISRLRPDLLILALTPNRKVYHQLSMDWGVIPIYCPHSNNIREAFQATSLFALKEKLISFGDSVVVTAGMPFGQTGSTNMMVLENIGDILVRGNKGAGPKVQGKVTIFLSPEGKDPASLKNRLAVLTYCDETFMPALKQAAGIILQNYIGDTSSEHSAEMIAKNYNIPVIIRADGATAILNEGDEVMLDPQAGLIYRGVEEFPICRLLGAE